MDEMPVNELGQRSSRGKFQFSLRSLLLIAMGVSMFFGLVVAGWYLVAFCYLATSSLCMMGADIIIGRVRRVWAAGLLLVGIGYAVGNFAVFTVTISRDPSAIFDGTYMIHAVFVTPGLMIIASVIVFAVSKKLDWFSILGFTLWIGCVAFANQWAILECAASV